MKLNFVGDFGNLSKLGKDLGVDRAKGFLGNLSRDLSEEALALVRLGFETGTDPSGKPWPRKRKKGASGRALIELGRLADSWQARSTYQFAEIYSNAPYAKFLHEGTRFIKPHRMVPTGRLPRRWRDRLAAVFWKNVQMLLRGRRA